LRSRARAEEPRRLHGSSDKESNWRNCKNVALHGSLLSSGLRGAVEIVARPELRTADAAPGAEQQPNQTGSLHDHLEAIE
jgi:hypothetical protein